MSGAAISRGGHCCYDSVIFSLRVPPMIGTLLNAIRRNHALEHGTVMIMLGRLPRPPRLAGRAAPDGFYIYGRVPTDLLTACAYEALGRFQRGEATLAVTPLCGTNIAVSGVLSGVAAMLAMGKLRTAARLPNVLSATMLGIVVGQPVGRLVQEHLTTRADLDRLEITGVRRGAGGWIHKVQTVPVVAPPNIKATVGSTASGG